MTYSVLSKQSVFLIGRIKFLRHVLCTWKTKMHIRFQSVKTDGRKPLRRLGVVDGRLIFEYLVSSIADVTDSCSGVRIT
jgi:hypothetical protein